MGCLFGVLALKGWLHREIVVRVPWILAGMLLFVLAGFLALGTATNASYVLGNLLLMCFFLVFGWAVAQVAVSDVQVRRLLGAMLVAACIATLIAILQYAGIFGDPALHPIRRVISTFGNRNYLGSFLGVLAIPSLALTLLLRRAGARVAAWAGSMLCFLGPALVQQTGIVLSLIVGLVFVLVGVLVFGLGCYVRRHVRLVGTLTLAILLGLGVGLTLWRLKPFGVEATSSGPIVAQLWESNSGETREVDWGTAWEMFKINPFTGVGLGNYKVDFLEYKTAFLDSPAGAQYTSPVNRAAQAHNDYVQIAAELGVPGIAATLLMLVLLCWSSWVRCRSIQDDARRMAYLLLLAGIVVGCAHAVVSFPFHLPVTGLTLVTLAGLASSTYFGDRATILGRATGTRARWITTVGSILLLIAMGFLVREFAAHLSFSAGVAAMEAGAPAHASELLERSLATSNLSAETKYRLASVSLWRSDQARQLGNQAQADELLQTAWSNALRSQAEYPTEQGLLLVAGIAVMLGEWQTAEDVLARLLTSRPRREFEKDGRYLLATLDAQRGDFDTAMAALRPLLDRFPTYMQPYILLGSLLLQQGRTDEADEVLNRGIHAANDQMTRITEELSTSSGSEREALLFDQQRLHVEMETMEDLLQGH